MTLGLERVDFPAGVYLQLTQLADVGDVRSSPQLRASALVALLGLAFDGFLVEKAFEGSVSDPNSLVFAPAGPMTLAARPAITVDDIRTRLAVSNTTLDSLSPEDRDRLELMSRWYRRGEETLNQVDKLLFLYLALEVFPAVDTTDVPGAVRDFLHERVFPESTPGHVKEALQLGRIAGLRADIVHSGKSSVQTDEMTNFSEKLELLEAVTRVCLRQLSGGAYEGELDKWVR